MKASIAIVAGTRPEVVKLAPVLRALKRLRAACHFVAIGQQAELVKKHLAELGIDSAVPIHAWKNKKLGSSLAFALGACDRALDDLKPAVVVVQGDTLTALAATWSAYSRRMPVAHVEAGLRSGSHDSPFPEEGIRKAIGQLATYHFAPTEAGRENLRAEGVHENVFVTGNTVIDELRSTSAPRVALVDAWFKEEIGSRRVVVVTCHRREGWSKYLPKVCDLVKSFPAERYCVVWPVHPNPNVENVVKKALSKHVRLSEPLQHGDFLDWLLKANLVITDSGGVIEEAAYMGVPTMIMREHTERQEAVGAGTAVLVPSSLSVSKMAELAKTLLTWKRRESFGIFGDGEAGERIARILTGVAMTRP